MREREVRFSRRAWAKGRVRSIQLLKPSPLTLPTRRAYVATGKFEMTHREETQGQAQAARSRGHFQCWRVVIVGAFVLTIGSDRAFDLPRIAEVMLGSLLVPFVDDPQFVLSYAVLVDFLPTLLLPFVGYAVDRWGPRRLVMFGLITLGVAFILHLGARLAWVSHLVTIAFVIGGVSGTLLPMAVAVNNWFRRRRGTAMAVMITASMVAFMMIAALGSSGTRLVVASPVASVFLVAGALLALAWPVSRLVKDRPEDHGQHPDGIGLADVSNGEHDQTSVVGPLSPDYEWREALRSRAFWLLVAGISGPAIVGVRTIYAGSLVDYRGFSVDVATTMVAISTFTAVPFVLVGGWLGDRLPIHRVLFGCAIVESVGVLILAFADGSAMFYMSAVLAGIGWGGAAALKFAAVGVYFGRRNYGTITGIVLSIGFIPGFLAGALVGLLRYFVDDWTLTMCVVALLSIVAAVAYLFLGNPRPSPSQL